MSTPAPSPDVTRFDHDGPVALLGDIHGRADLLGAMLAQLGPERQIIICGDTCDRGPDTRGVIDLLLQCGAVGVRGNHEEWLISWASGAGFDAFALHPAMGGEATLRSYGVRSRDPGAVEAARRQVPREHLAFLQALPLVLDLRVSGERFWVVHGGVPGARWPRTLDRSEILPWMVANRPDQLLWERSEPRRQPPLDRPVIMGHIIQPAPVDVGHHLALDTGCGTVPGAPLTAWLLPERRFVQVGPADLG